MPNQSEARIVCLIATAGRPEDLRSTLLSIKKCNLPECFDGVIVVENGMRQGAEGVCEEASCTKLQVAYRYSETPGKSIALNQVLEELDESTFVLMTDDDVSFDAAWIEAYLLALRSSGSGWFYGGPCLVQRERDPPDWMISYLPRSVTGWRPRPSVFDPGKDVFMGCNWGAFAYDLRRTGGFDQRFGPGAVTSATGQESEMQRQLFRLGLKSYYIPDATVSHYVPAQRCSIPWVLHRSRRGGISRGIRVAERPYLKRLPNHLLQAVRYPLSYFLKKVGELTNNEPLGFKGRFGIYRIKGYFKGVRRRHTEQSNSPAFDSAEEPAA